MGISLYGDYNHLLNLCKSVFNVKPMFNYLLAQIESLMNDARTTYGVNPLIFIVIYVICVPIFYYSIFQTIRSLSRKDTTQVLVWSMVFLFSNVAPFLYVILFGHNIPWWVFIIIAILIAQAIISLFLRSSKSIK